MITRRLLLATLLLILAGSGLLARSSRVQVYLNGRPVAAEVIVRDGVTYVPAHLITQATGLPVEWDSSHRALYIGTHDRTYYSPSPAAPARRAAPAPKRSSASDTVYITRTGKKYHRDGCRYLARSKIPISRKDAIAQGYTPCSVCNP